MKRLLVLAGIALALMTTTSNNASGGVRPTNCHAPIMVSN
jgi:hypothetical protein